MRLKLGPPGCPTETSFLLLLFNSLDSLIALLFVVVKCPFTVTITLIFISGITSMSNSVIVACLGDIVQKRTEHADCYGSM